MLFAFAGASGAATVPGWSVARANVYLEANLRLVDPGIVAAAKEAAWTNLQPAGVVGGEPALQRAKAGIDVRQASCLGVTPASTGYSSFNCAVLLGRDTGYKAGAFGELKRLANGDWRWVTAAFSRTTSGLDG
jgi:hypothetical protein